jgi:hypothetical protein
MTNIKAILKKAKRRQATEQVCLRGDLAGKYEDLEQQLAQLPTNTKLGGDPERQRITAEMDRLRAEMQEGTVPFVLLALPDAEFQELVDAHPPRREGDEVNEGDARSGYNRATFYRALIRACVVEPELDAEDWELLFAEGISAGQRLKLSNTALRISSVPVDVPFSPAGSSESQD